MVKTAEDLVEPIKSTVIQWRRNLHQNPELSYQEEGTSQFVYETLQSFGDLTVTRPTKTSVMAQLKGGKPGKVLALRADIDALPIHEKTELSFSSQKPRVMHACGHDGHTAMLLGAAKVLTKLKNTICGEVRFIFQHAEEMFPGGAKEMVEAGVMEGVDEVFGLHLFPMFPAGKIGLCSGPFTANDDVFDIEIVGKGGHAAQPHQSVDPIAIGAQVVSNLQHILSRTTDPLHDAVLSITEFHGGTAKNIIPDFVKLGGGVRSFDAQVRQDTVKNMERIVKGVTEAHQASYIFDYHYGYDSVYNDPELTGKIEEIVINHFGANSLLILQPLLIGEDFSRYLQKAPGCFIGIGAAFKNDELNYPLHHPNFNIDENSLEIGLKLLVYIAATLLK
nr:amidohydrolase [Neobacillus mesonae]